MCKPTVTSTYSIYFRGFTIRSYQFRTEKRYRIFSSRPINHRNILGWDTTIHRCKDRCRVMLRKLGVNHLKKMK